MVEHSIASPWRLQSARPARGFGRARTGATFSSVDANEMKLALFADIHSNLEAITACLAHARGLGADRYAFLGDLVGYGADPVAVLDLIEQHAAEGAIVVLGNHDAAVLGRPDDTLSNAAKAVIAWTQSQIGASQRAFLERLPL